MNSPGVVEIEYCAALREMVGTDRERVSTDAVDCATLWDEVVRRHGLYLPAARIRVAVDDQFVDWVHPIAPGARVCFMPPFAGG